MTPPFIPETDGGRSISTNNIDEAYLSEPAEESVIDESELLK